MLKLDKYFDTKYFAILLIISISPILFYTLNELYHITVLIIIWVLGASIIMRLIKMKFGSEHILAWCSGGIILAETIYLLFVLSESHTIRIEDLKSLSFWLLLIKIVMVIGLIAGVIFLLLHKLNSIIQSIKAKRKSSISDHNRGT